MNWAIDLMIIRGLMFGIEYYTDWDEKLFFIIVDVGPLRFIYTKEMEEE
jgi:hypothetical protein